MRAKPKTALTGTPAPVLISSGKAWNERWNSACPSSTARMGLAAGSVAPFGDESWDRDCWLMVTRGVMSRGADDTQGWPLLLSVVGTSELFFLQISHPELQAASRRSRRPGGEALHF